ncbi:MAG TPA: porin family protein [Gemmatimonadota bacterium]|nr:porin family protein [Gemmatimonadota bacterium]
MSRLALFAGLVLFAAPVLAADNGVYVGAGIGQSNVQVDASTDLPGFDGDDTGFKLIAGVRPLDWLAAEVNYVDLGAPEGDVAGTRIATDASGITAFGIALLELPFLDLYGKLGAVRWDVTASIPDIGLSGDASGTDLAWGAGAQLRFLSFGLRLEYERFEISDFDDSDFLSLSVTYTFL